MQDPPKGWIVVPYHNYWCRADDIVGIAIYKSHNWDDVAGEAVAKTRKKPAWYHFKLFDFVCDDDDAHGPVLHIWLKEDHIRFTLSTLQEAEDAVNEILQAIETNS